MWWMMVFVMALFNGVSCYGSAAHPSISCEEARFKCAQREGCGMALENYLTGCSAVLHYQMKYCPGICRDSLIALTSTDEGKALMTCECSDDVCEETKQRVDICRPEVIRANKNETVVNCHVAQLICSADPACAMALEYYEHYCKSMFYGKKCTSRCRNSIYILRRLEKSAKLRNCYCAGRDSANCTRIQNNMAKLCYHKKVNDSNEIPTEHDQKSRAVLAAQINTFVVVLMALILTSST
ncbi:hypothetical protein AMK59_1527 [Oryctes borbonicus]|uniref:GDNF/GAS1 domain-containing protein n=1 Tax=Oryctes borbonicus TaxID=1629725 RepID=A0A0T6BBZ5_9SCAR|nr:hypothetical protein AMK59_1527 [Oryctes borbonicus]